MNSPQSPGQKMSPRDAAASRDDRRAAWAGILAATLIVAVLGALASAGEADSWYRSLAKAPGSPPQLAFTVVQPILYVLMAVGAGLTWNAAGAWREADDAMGVYFVQLIASLGWSVMFFQLHAPIAALFDVLAQWMLVLAMMASFARRTELAAQLQVPYLLWLTLTACINAWVVFAN